MGKRPHDADENSPEYEEVARTVGSQIRKARQQAGLTQAQLGAKAGLTQSYIFEMEAGGANITLKTLAKMASVLGMDARDLLPESRTTPLSTTALERLQAVVERAASVLSVRQSQEAELLSELRSLGDLRLAIERSLKDGHSPEQSPPQAEGSARRARGKKASH
jgi:transcriptional regulator with XRE-family HTH domain